MENIVVLFGGVSPEYEVSLNSAAYVIRGLRKFKGKYNVLPIGISRRGKWYYYKGSEDSIASGEWVEDKINLREAFIVPTRGDENLYIFNKDNSELETNKVDVVFPVLHGRNGEDGTIQGLCELAGIPYVGCDVTSSSVCMDKVVANALFSFHGIRQAEYIWIYGYDYLKDSKNIVASLLNWCDGKYPVFVKPACCGSSCGTSKVSKKRGT